MKTYQQIMADADARFTTLGITKEMAKAVIDHLAELGVLQTCYVKDSPDCKGPCPTGQGCMGDIRNNCVCSKKFDQFKAEVGLDVLCKCR